MRVLLFKILCTNYLFQAVRYLIDYFTEVPGAVYVLFSEDFPDQNQVVDVRGDVHHRGGFFPGLADLPILLGFEFLVLLVLFLAVARAALRPDALQVVLGEFPLAGTYLGFDLGQGQPILVRHTRGGLDIRCAERDDEVLELDDVNFHVLLDYDRPVDVEVHLVNVLRTEELYTHIGEDFPVLHEVDNEEDPVERLDVGLGLHTGFVDLKDATRGEGLGEVAELRHQNLDGRLLDVLGHRLASEVHLSRAPHDLLLLDQYRVA